MDLRRLVMDQPEDQRLEAALAIIEDLSGQGGKAVGYLSMAFNLSRMEAEVLALLNRRAPDMVSQRALLTAIWGPWSDGWPEKSLTVYICKLRRKLRGTSHQILTVHRQGYALSAPIDVPADVDVPALQAGCIRREWSDSDDAELVRMRENGSAWWAIAEELNRTERACKERFYRLQRGVSEVAA